MQTTTTKLSASRQGLVDKLANILTSHCSSQSAFSPNTSFRSFLLPECFGSLLTPDLRRCLARLVIQSQRLVFPTQSWHKPISHLICGGDDNRGHCVIDVYKNIMWVTYENARELRIRKRDYSGWIVVNTKTISDSDGVSSPGSRHFYINSSDDSLKEDPIYEYTVVPGHLVVFYMKTDLRSAAPAHYYEKRPSGCSAYTMIPEMRYNAAERINISESLNRVATYDYRNTDTGPVLLEPHRTALDIFVLRIPKRSIEIELPLKRFYPTWVPRPNVTLLAELCATSSSGRYSIIRTSLVDLNDLKRIASRAAITVMCRVHIIFHDNGSSCTFPPILKYPTMCSLHSNHLVISTCRAGDPVYEYWLDV